MSVFSQEQSDGCVEEGLDMDPTQLQLDDYPTFTDKQSQKYSFKSKTLGSVRQVASSRYGGDESVYDVDGEDQARRSVRKALSTYSSRSRYTQRRRVSAEEEDLSDAQDKERQELSQYEASLFPERAKEIQSHKRSYQDSTSLMKSSQITRDNVTRRSRGRGRRPKSEKTQKGEDAQSVATQGNAEGETEKAKTKKRFTKGQLELVSRKFQDYYSYETKREHDGQKITLRDIGMSFDLGHATIHKLYAEWMDDPHFYERIKRYDRYRAQSKNPERRMTLDRLEHITRLIKENPFLTQNQLCVQLNKIEELKIVRNGHRVHMTRTVIGKLLKMGKFRKKRVKCVPKEKNTTNSLEKRYEYCLKFKEIIERNSKVYYLDESGFNLYMTRDKAWSRPNEEVTVNCPISKGKRFSLIAIIGEDGLAHWRFIQGNYRKFQYLDFIRQLFVKLAESAREQQQQDEKWIVMDNCAIHDKEQTINLAKQYGINILYLPSYSPQLNPIENWFHEIKCKLKKINYSGEQQLFQIMAKILEKYEERDFSNYYHGTLRFVEKGLRKEKF